ncbi:MAG: hypothetical protein NT162_03725 [Candidatus Woesebacteria bacterium]|nr:hypothetical protein [Candidatus Woesebacteria bacterium]
MRDFVANGEINGKKMDEMQIAEQKHREQRLTEYITRGEMEGWAGMVHERSDIAFKAVRVILRSLLRNKVLTEEDLSKEEGIIRDEIKALEKNKSLCPNEFERKNDTNLCKICKIKCPFENSICDKPTCDINLGVTLEDKK